MNPLNTTPHQATLDALLAGSRDTAMDDATDRYNVPALERGLRMLGAFGEGDSALSAPELVRRFDLPRSTVFRLLTTLESLGFVERSESGRDYARYEREPAGNVPKPTSSKLALGYVYNLSKRSAMYATVARLTNSNGASQALGGVTTSPNHASTGTEFGMRHAF